MALVPVLLCLLAAPPNALAEDAGLPTQPNSAPGLQLRMEFKLEGGMRHTGLPSLSYGQNGWAAAATGPLFDTQPNIESETFRGTFGLVLPRHGLAIELQGEQFDGRDRADIQTPTGTRATYVSVDGERQILFGAGSPSARIDVRLRGFQSALRLKTRFDIGPSARLSPSIGVAGGTRKQRYALDIATPFAGGTMENPIEVAETLHTREIGPELGVELKVGVGKRVSVDVKAHGAALQSRTRLEARDCLGNATAIGGACDGGFFQTRTEEIDDVTNLRVTGSVGANLTLPVGLLTVSGFGGWDSMYAGIRNPTSENRTPASIRYDDQYHYGWRAGYALPLN